ncbi:MAG: hypothetical protein ACXACX_03000, partial [Candidatus Hodarchaeales archaeon]
IEIIRRILGGNQLNLLKPLSVGQEVRLNIRKEDSYDKITFALNLPLFNKIYKETSFVPIIDQVNFFYSQKKVSDTENEEESFQDIIIPGMKINFISSKVIKKEKRLQKSSLEMDLIHLDNECLSNFKKKDLKKKDYLQYFNPSKELLSEEE